MRAISSTSNSSKYSKPRRAPGRLVTGLHAGVARRHGLHTEAGADLVVVGEEAVGVRHENAPPRVGVGRGDRTDRSTLGPGRRVGDPQELDLARLRHRLGLHRDVVRVGRGPGQRDLADAAASRPRGCGRGFRGLGEPRFGQVGRVREPRRVAPNHPDAGAPRAAGGELLDSTVVEATAAAAAILGEHLREIAAAAQRGAAGCARGLVLRSTVLSCASLSPKSHKCHRCTRGAYRTQMHLTPGMAASVNRVVEPIDTAIAFRSGDVPVIATPRVVGLAEEATVIAVADALPAGQTTVGSAVQLTHLAPSSGRRDRDRRRRPRVDRGAPAGLSRLRDRRPRPRRGRLHHQSRRRTGALPRARPRRFLKPFTRGCSNAGRRRRGRSTRSRPTGPRSRTRA